MGFFGMKTDTPFLLMARVCRKKGYLKLTTEFGKWAAPIVPSELPDCIEVDYVRVYQKTSSESVSAK